MIDQIIRLLAIKRNLLRYSRTLIIPADSLGLDEKVRIIEVRLDSVCLCREDGYHENTNVCIFLIKCSLIEINQPPERLTLVRSLD